MNLLFVAKSLSLQGGGAERVLAEVTAGLVLRVNSVTVASFDAPNSVDFHALHPQIARKRPGVGDTHRPSRLVDMLRQVGALRREVKELAPDAIIGFMHSAYIRLCFVTARTGIPLIASEHAVYGHNADKPVQRALLRLTAVLPSAFITISEDVRRGFPESIGRKTVINPNPVSSGLAAHVDVIGGAQEILTIGRLSEEKGHQTLIRAFARIAQAFPEWRLAHHGATDTPHQVAHLFDRFWGTTMTVCLLLGLAPEPFVVLLFPPTYAASAAWIFPLSVATVLSNVYIFWPGFTVNHWAMGPTTATMGSGAPGVGINVLAVMHWDAPGAVAGTLASSIVFLLSWILLSNRCYRIPVSLVKMAFVSTCAAAVYAFAALHGSIGTIGVLAATKAIAAIAVFVVIANVTMSASWLNVGHGFRRRQS